MHILRVFNISIQQYFYLSGVFLSTFLTRFHSRADGRTHFCGQSEPFATIFFMSRKLPGVTGEVLEAAMDVGRASNTAPSSSESKPSTLAPKAFRRATTPGAFEELH